MYTANRGSSISSFTNPRVVYGIINGLYTNVVEQEISFAQFNELTSDTIQGYETIELELAPFDCSRFSGALDFWEDSSEDIYGLDDGEPL